MTDLEITRLCAEAMKLRIELVTRRGRGGRAPYYRFASDWNEQGVYRPLYDDAQAMALVKKFGAFIQGGPVRWEVEICDKTVKDADDLNRAICECAAKMQKDKLE